MRQYVITLVLYIGGCVHIPKAPPSFAAYGRQCQKVREVNCFVDDDMSAEWCHTYAVTSIDIINKAVGHQLLRYGGDIKIKDDGNAALAVGHILVFGDKLPDAILGITQVGKGESMPYPDCLGRTAIAISNQVTGDHAVASLLSLQVMLHEFVHALGGNHAASKSVYRSIMTPTVGDEAWTDHLSSFDIAALRAIYG